MSYKVVIQEAARLDIRSIIEYISNDFNEPLVAEKLVRCIADRINRLTDYPKRNKRLNDEPFYSKGYRVTYVKNYAIFYYVDDKLNTVNVMHILYNRREWQDLL